MAGYIRVDTSNNIADGNVIAAADLDNEFDGVQDAFSASTGHTHGGAVGEGAPIVKLGPNNDVTISATLLAPKTTNTVDLGSSLLKFKDLNLAGNASIAGTLGVTGVATFTAQPILSSLTASRAVFSDASKGLVSNAITGTGDVVMSTSPTLTNVVFDGDYTEEVFTITDGASVDLDPSNGTVQIWTLGASRTATASSFASGQSMTLMIDDGTAYAITWPSVTWKTDGGSAPTLNTTGFTAIQLWKVSTVLYGARVGDA